MDWTSSIPADIGESDLCSDRFLDDLLEGLVALVLDFDEGVDEELPGAAFANATALALAIATSASLSARDE